MASSCSTTSFPFELEFSYSVCSHIQFTFTYRDTCAYTSTDTAMWLCPSQCKEWIYIAANQMKITNSTAQKRKLKHEISIKIKEKKRSAIGNSMGKLKLEFDKFEHIKRQRKITPIVRSDLWSLPKRENLLTKPTDTKRSESIYTSHNTNTRTTKLSTCGNTEAKLT